MHHAISARLYRELTRMLSRRQEIAEKLKTPLLLLLAGEDYVVSRDMAISFFNEVLVTDKELEVYKAFYHEILNEVDRKRVYLRILQWIQAHL